MMRIVMNNKKKSPPSLATFEWLLKGMSKLADKNHPYALLFFDVFEDALNKVLKEAENGKRE